MGNIMIEEKRQSMERQNIYHMMPLSLILQNDNNQWIGKYSKVI